jgi:hypothetical protein
MTVKLLKALNLFDDGRKFRQDMIGNLFAGHFIDGFETQIQNSGYVEIIISTNTMFYPFYNSFLASADAIVP